MIRHHQGGIDMAASVPRETRNDAVRVTALAHHSHFSVT
jgi:uncharacterized protein (DUF305 family)